MQVTEHPKDVDFSGPEVNNDDTFWKEFMLKSSQNVQNCQCLKFLEWETGVYIWTFENLIEHINR